MTRPLVALALSALLFAAVPAAAQAKNYKGRTSQSREVKLRTGADGVVNRVALGWRAPCGEGYRFNERTIFRPQFDLVTADAVQDAGTYRVRYRGGLRARITVTLAGARDPATDRWSGTLAGTVMVSRKGKVIDRCRVKRLRWNAR
jgi:hypothetical protein